MFSLIGNFDLNQDGKVSFGEFVQSLWHLQKVDDYKEHMQVSQSLRESSLFQNAHPSLSKPHLDSHEVLNI